MKTRKRDLSVSAFLTENECRHIAYVLEMVAEDASSASEKAAIRGDGLECMLKEWQEELCAYVAVAFMTVADGFAEFTIVNLGEDD